MSVSPHSSAGMPTRSAQVFYPLQTVRCIGPAVFRSQLARDVGCLLDIDDDVTSWSCQPVVFSSGGEKHRADFHVRRGTANFILNTEKHTAEFSDEIIASISQNGWGYEYLDRMAISPVRLKNAKDLLRYGGYETPLSDRIRLLAALEENGSLSVAECLSAFQDIKPIAGLASLFLHRFIVMDVDQIIGPETQVSRAPN